MGYLAPVGAVYQAGTLSGNPVAVAAGIAALDLARELDPPIPHGFGGDADRWAREDVRGPRTAGDREPSRIAVQRLLHRCGGSDFGGARAANHERFGRFFHHMLDRGVWLPPSGYELWTLGTEHGPEEIERVLTAASSFGG